MTQNKIHLRHKDLILGLADGYGTKELAAFVLSAQRHVPEADIVMLVSRLDQETIRFLESQQVHCLDCSGHFQHGEKWWNKLCANRRMPESYVAFLKYAFFYSYYLLQRKWVTWLWHRIPSPQSKTWRGWYQRFLPPSNRRYFLYQELMDNLEPKPERILLTDVSDVIFQGNPFSRIQGEWIEFAEENRAHTIESLTLDWLQWTGTATEAARLLKKPILCSGTTMGSAQTIESYLHQMVNRLMDSAYIMGHGLDQGAHYHVAYAMIQSGEGRAFPNGLGFALTAAMESSDFLVWQGEGARHLKSEVFCPLLHQYNRHPHLVQRIDELYPHR